MRNLLEKYLPLHAIADEGQGGEGSGEGNADDTNGGEGEITTLLGADDEEVGDGDGDVDDENEQSENDEKPDGDSDESGEGNDDGEDDDDAEYEDDPELTDEENQQKREEFDAEKAKKKEEAKSKKDEVDPASYEIDVPEGFVLDPELETQFREFGAKKKLTQEDMNELSGMQMKIREKAVADAVDMQKGWVKSLREDKEIGGKSLDANLGAARQVIKDVFVPYDKGFQKMLNSTGLGSYPPFVKGMVKVSELMGEAGIITGKGGAGDESTEDVLYGKT